MKLRCGGCLGDGFGRGATRPCVKRWPVQVRPASVETNTRPSGSVIQTTSSEMGEAESVAPEPNFGGNPAIDAVTDQSTSA